MVSGDLACSKEEAASLACIQLRIEETWEPPSSTQCSSLAPPSTPCLNIHSPTTQTGHSSSSTSSTHLAAHLSSMGQGAPPQHPDSATFVFSSGGIANCSTVASFTGGGQTSTSTNAFPPSSPSHGAFLVTPNHQPIRVSKICW